ALDQAEHVRVGAALDLAEQAALVVVEELDLVDLRQAVGQELLAEVEAPAADHVAVDVPADALRDLDAPGIAPGVQRRRSQLLLSHVHRAHSSRSRVGSVLPRAASNGSTTARGAVCERKVFARFPRRNAVLPLCMGRRAPLYSVAPRPQAPGALRSRP